MLVPEPLFQVLDIYTAHQEGLVADNLCRRKLRDLVQKLPLVIPPPSPDSRRY